MTATASTLLSADGIWHGLRLMPGASGDTASPAGLSSIAVVDGRIAWIGLDAALPSHFTALPALPSFDGQAR